MKFRDYQIESSEEKANSFNGLGARGPSTPPPPIMIYMYTLYFYNGLPPIVVGGGGVRASSEGIRDRSH